MKEKKAANIIVSGIMLIIMMILFNLFVSYEKNEYINTKSLKIQDGYNHLCNITGKENISISNLHAEDELGAYHGENHARYSLQQISAKNRSVTLYIQNYDTGEVIDSWVYDEANLQLKQAITPEAKNETPESGYVKIMLSIVKNIYTILGVIIAIFAIYKIAIRSFKVGGILLIASISCEATSIIIEKIEPQIAVFIGIISTIVLIIGIEA